MTLRVWKYTLPLNDDTTILNMPMHAELLHFDNQNGIPTMWVLVDPEGGDGSEVRSFRIVGTGHKLKDDVFYYSVGTAIFGPFVWHLFEVRN